MAPQDDDEDGEFNWDSKQQGFILGCFYYGYVSTQILGGYLAERFGGKVIMGGGLLASSVITMLFPVAAKTSTGFFIALRVVQGMCEGLAFPSLYPLVARWLPAPEKNRLFSCIVAGIVRGQPVMLLEIP